MTQPRWSRQAVCSCGGQPGMPPQVTLPTAAKDSAEHLRALQNVQRLFHGEWTAAILVVLSDGPKHYKQIRDRIRSLVSTEKDLERRRVLHDSVLTRTLKSLTTKELIEREQKSTSFPPSVEYALTPATAEALAAWDSVVDWARKHADLVSRTRRRA
jgi:DNA-binding HxlR family transcriptional regulator